MREPFEPPKEEPKVGEVIAQHGSIRVVREVDRYRAYSIDGDLTNHQQSGDHPGISGTYIAMLEGSTRDLVIFDTRTNKFYPVGNERPGGGHLNVNLVWTDVVGEYYIVAADRKLERRKVSVEAPIWSTTLPLWIVGPTGTLVKPQWRLSAGSGESHPWIGVFITGHTGCVWFDADNGDRDAPFLFANLTGGSSRSSMAGNIQSMGQGKMLTFKPLGEDQHLQHVTDGVTKTQIEPAHQRPRTKSITQRSLDSPKSLVTTT